MKGHVGFCFTAEETRRLREALLDVAVSPYENYTLFSSEISRVILAGVLPTSFLVCVDNFVESKSPSMPFLLIRGAPLDMELPLLDNVQPTQSKRRLKKTFVAEGFLELFSQTIKCPAVGYREVDNGEIFRDVLPKQSMFGSLTGQSLGAFPFHRDLADNLIRLDYLNLLSLRGSEDHPVYTSMVSNHDILNNLDSNDCCALEAGEFLTRLTSEDEVQHPVIQDGGNLFFLEGQTRGLTSRASAAITAVTRIAHDFKCQISMRPGDFLSIRNWSCLHAREVEGERDLVPLHRWTMKTVNVKSLEPYLEYLELVQIPIFSESRRLRRGRCGPILHV